MRQPTAIEKITEKQKLNFRKTFLKDIETLCVDTSGRGDVKDLHAKRSEIKKMAKGLLTDSERDKRSLTECEKDAFDACTYLLEDVSLAFDCRAELQSATAAINGVMNASTSTGTVSRSLETWQDLKTGKAIPVLEARHKFSDHIQRTDNVSARDCFAALAGHNVSEEVRSAMSIGQDTKGGYFTLPEFLSADIIDLMRAKNVVTQAGARTIPLPAAVTRVCRIDSDPKASWVGENALIPDTDMSIGAIDFNAHKLTCLVKISRELLQDAGNAGTVIMNAIATAMAAELDSAALYGTGVGQPLGIANNTDISTYTLGTGNGAVLSGYDDLLQGISKVIGANGPIATAAIMSPRTLIGYSLLKDGQGKPLERPDLIKNMAFYDTTKVPVNQVEGTSSDCSSIILGGFSELVVGIRSVLEIQVLQEKFADYGQVGYLATMRADTCLYQPQSICKVGAIKP